MHKGEFRRNLGKISEIQKIIPDKHRDQERRGRKEGRGEWAAQIADDIGF